MNENAIINAKTQNMKKKKSKKNISLTEVLLSALLMGALMWLQNNKEKEDVLKIEERTIQTKIKTYDIVFKSFYAMMLLIALILIIVKL